MSDKTVSGPAVLSVRAIGKVYPPASIVLRGVDLELAGGRVHGLLGRERRGQEHTDQDPLRDRASNLWRHPDGGIAVRFGSRGPRTQRALGSASCTRNCRFFLT